MLYPTELKDAGSATSADITIPIPGQENLESILGRNQPHLSSSS